MCDFYYFIWTMNSLHPIELQDFIFLNNYCIWLAEYVVVNRLDLNKLFIYVTSDWNVLTCDLCLEKTF